MERPGAAASMPGLSTRAVHARAAPPRPSAPLVTRSVRSATLSSEPEPGGEEAVSGRVRSFDPVPDLPAARLPERRLRALARGTLDAFFRPSKMKAEPWADPKDAPER